MTSQPAKQKIAVDIFTNISRCKHNQTIKFGHLIEFDMRNISLGKSYLKCGGETITWLLSKQIKLSIPPGQ